MAVAEAVAGEEEERCEAVLSVWNAVRREASVSM